MICHQSTVKIKQGVEHTFSDNEVKSQVIKLGHDQPLHQFIFDE